MFLEHLRAFDIVSNGAKLTVPILFLLASVSINGQIISQTVHKAEGCIGPGLWEKVILTAFQLGKGFKLQRRLQKYNPAGPQELIDVGEIEVETVRVGDNPIDLPDGSTAIAE